MTESITIQTIFLQHAQSLQLSWIFGEKIVSAPLIPKTCASQDFVGLLSLIHHYQITLIGQEQLQGLQTLSELEFKQCLDNFFSLMPHALIFCEQVAPPPPLLLRAKKNRLPVLQSQLTSDVLSDMLTQQLSVHFAEHTTLHGVFMDVLGIGILLAGDSGIGKSELALGLINCGHRLIADDAVIFTRVTNDKLIGSCPPLLKDFLEVRGLGIINIRAMFGDNAIKDNKRLQLIVRVVLMDHQALRAVNRLEGSHANKTILQVSVPEVTIPVTPGRPLAVLVEAAVRNQILKFSGYDSNQEFVDRQQHQIEVKAP